IANDAKHPRVVVTLPEHRKGRVDGHDCVRLPRSPEDWPEPTCTGSEVYDRGNASALGYPREFDGPDLLGKTAECSGLCVPRRKGRVVISLHASPLATCCLPPHRPHQPS